MLLATCCRVVMDLRDWPHRRRGHVDGVLRRGGKRDHTLAPEASVPDTPMAAARAIHITPDVVPIPVKPSAPEMHGVRREARANASQLRWSAFATHSEFPVKRWAKAHHQPLAPDRDWLGKARGKRRSCC